MDSNQKIPRIGQRYKHYKGGEYQIISVSRFEPKPSKILVTYFPLYFADENGQIRDWTRTLENFLEEVEVDGKKVPRFKMLK